MCSTNSLPLVFAAMCQWLDYRTQLWWKKPLGFSVALFPVTAVWELKGWL